MRVSVVFVGKTSPSWLVEGVEEYAKRMVRFMDLSFQVVNPSGNQPPAQSVEKEGQAILSKITPKDKVILLDEHGKKYTSVQLSAFIDKMNVSGVSSLVFVTGGPYGLSQAVRDRADYEMSFSDFTFTHQMIRLLLLEQLYRAMTISNRIPYHNE
ncbi:MAG: 23S rRNA (pseudouridine(1915)-N(3))-methyltransferase RlmH [Bacteroidota bacterium]